ncbi:MAG: hypothetical protein ACKOE6_15655 [Flammeovirgaceae bacterium]
MNMIKKAIFTLGAVVAPSILWAHAGHGHDNPLSPGHYVTNPEHSVQLVLIVAASVAIAWLINQSVKKITEEK